MRRQGLLKTAVTFSAIENDAESRDTFLRGARILAIDDSRTYLTELSNKLTANGFQVSTASSGRRDSSCSVPVRFTLRSST